MFAERSEEKDNSGASLASDPQKCSSTYYFSALRETLATVNRWHPFLEGSNTRSVDV